MELPVRIRPSGSLYWSPLLLGIVAILWGLIVVLDAIDSPNLATIGVLSMGIGAMFVAYTVLVRLRCRLDFLPDGFVELSTVFKQRRVPAIQCTLASVSIPFIAGQPTLLLLRRDQSTHVLWWISFRATLLSKIAGEPGYSRRVQILQSKLRNGCRMTGCTCTLEMFSGEIGHGRTD
jgi:hypothetical protein